MVKKFLFRATHEAAILFQSTGLSRTWPNGIDARRNRLEIIISFPPDFPFSSIDGFLVYRFDSGCRIRWGFDSAVFHPPVVRRLLKTRCFRYVGISEFPFSIHRFTGCYRFKGCGETDF